MPVVQEPISIRLEASTLCQLKCPSCPTAQGETKKNLGSGVLAFQNFKDLVDRNPAIVHIELSNWGEIFLNPELTEIMKYAYKKGVILTASNGANLNTVKPSVLEDLVKYKFRHIDCSIDGASQETYKQYRVGGNFDRVIENIKTINHYKKVYKSDFPLLLWQFVAFGHNEHEIQTARELAKELDMEFYLKLSWDEEVSPIQDKELVRQQTSSGMSSRSEYAETYGTGYIRKDICQQLWTSPQINWDGRVLGCCFNYWGDFGNVFEADGKQGYQEKMGYAQDMVMGKADPRNDIPCTRCEHYKTMQESGDWMTPGDLRGPTASPVVAQIAKRCGRLMIGILNRSEWLSSRFLKPAIVNSNKTLRE